MAALAGALTLTACSRTVYPPTAEDEARERHEATVEAANTLLMGDRLAWFATDDDVERANTTCRGDVCAAGFLALSQATQFSLEDWELTLLGERRGVGLFRQDLSADGNDHEAWGGWLEHSLFATRLTRFGEEAGSSAGASVAFGYSLGFSSGDNPGAEGSARWEGLMLGRDLRASARRGQAIRGDADVTVAFGAGTVTADVAFTGIVNVATGDAWGDMAWRGMAVENGAFARRNAPDDTVSGRFYGPEEEEVGGVFERDGVAGAFGGWRRSAP